MDLSLKLVFQPPVKNRALPNLCFNWSSLIGPAWPAGRTGVGVTASNTNSYGGGGDVGSGFGGTAGLGVPEAGSGAGRVAVEGVRAGACNSSVGGAAGATRSAVTAPVGSEPCLTSAVAGDGGPTGAAGIPGDGVSSAPQAARQGIPRRGNSGMSLGNLRSQHEQTTGQGR